MNFTNFINNSNWFLKPLFFDDNFTFKIFYLFLCILLLLFRLMAGAFRATVWDPALIVSQIVCLQSAFYSAETTLMFLWSVTGYRPLVGHIFSPKTQHPMVVIQLLSVIFCSALFPIIIGRARLCLDFTVTLHFIHFLIVVLCNWVFPTQLLWWLLQLISASICTMLGEWLCSRRECAEIPLAHTPSNTTRIITA